MTWHDEAKTLRAAGMTYEEIGWYLRKDHSSVMYACDPYFRSVKEKRRLQRSKP